MRSNYAYSENWIKVGYIVYTMLPCWIFQYDELDEELLAKFYPKTQALLNYKLLCNYNETEINPELRTTKHIFYTRIELIKKLLLYFNIRHQDDFEYSINSGNTDQGRKNNRKNNPAIMNKDTFNTILTQQCKSILVSKEYKQAFQIGSVSSSNPSDRQLLEWLKIGLKHFGLIVDVIKTTKRVIHEDTAKFTKDYNYLIDLNDQMVELFYNNTHGDIDILIDSDNKEVIEFIYDF